MRRLLVSGRHLYNTHMNDIIDKNENMTIPYYLMASYAYQ